MPAKFFTPIATSAAANAATLNTPLAALDAILQKWDYGTSFPPTPTVGNRFFRTDLGLLCYYDGTRWLTVEEYALQVPKDSVFTADAVSYFAVLRTDYAPYLTRVVLVTNVAATNDGSHYWGVALRGVTLTGSAAEILDQFDTSADTQAVNTLHEHAPGNLATSNDRQWLQLYCTKVSTPGNLTVNGTIFYRLIVP